MECEDCNTRYTSDNPQQPCPQCGGKGVVLVDVTKDFYPNRAARRAAHGERISKWLPCPECQKPE